MVHALHNPSLIIDVTIFGTTLGCITLAFFQWSRAKKKSDEGKRDKRDNPL
jgi:hypothetical protein